MACIQAGSHRVLCSPAKRSSISVKEKKSKRQASLIRMNSWVYSVACYCLRLFDSLDQPNVSFITTSQKPNLRLQAVLAVGGRLEYPHQISGQRKSNERARQCWLSNTQRKPLSERGSGLPLLFLLMRFNHNPPNKFATPKTFRPSQPLILLVLQSPSLLRQSSAVSSQ